ncbi:MAG: GlxA family transcriptional regulator [Actinomycetota bacterium]|nr:GlxA family transcriptional regulator [Actinomycetota bacterium]
MHRIAFVLFDGFNLLDLAGPLEVLHTATRLGADPAGVHGGPGAGYEPVITTLDGRPARSASGAEVGVDVALAACGPVDTLVVVGGTGAGRAARDEATISALGGAAAGAGRVASVCTGARVLAAAGLLDGYRATTHWASCARLAADHPQVDVEPDRIHVHDRDRWTSAGVTAGIDLFLALVEHDGGAALAHRVAGWLVVFVRRPGGQDQFSAQLRTDPATSPAIAELQRWLVDHLGDDLSVAALARRAGMSTRSFARTFRAETGTTPAAHVEALRVEAARRLLETTDLTVAVIATSVGLNRPETLYRAFRRHVGTTPDSYRRHFGRRPGDGNTRPLTA